MAISWREQTQRTLRTVQRFGQSSEEGCKVRKIDEITSRPPRQHRHHKQISQEDSVKILADDFLWDRPSAAADGLCCLATRSPLTNVVALYSFRIKGLLLGS